MKKNVKDSIWELVEKEAKAIVSKYPENFRFNENSEYIFKQKFDDYVEYIKSKFMQSDVVDLDSHKVAAIIICSVIEANVIKVIYEYDEEKLLFDGNEKIAINIGLSYMSSVMKKLLQGYIMRSKFVTFLLMMCTTLTLFGCSNSNSASISDNEIDVAKEDVVNTDFQNTENYEVAFENNDIQISLDTANIVYDGSQLNINISAENKRFEQFNMHLESVVINGNADYTDKMYFGEMLGSGIVSDNVPNEFNSRKAIITTTTDVGEVNSIDISFTMINQEYDILLVTTRATIAKVDVQYKITEVACVNEDESKLNWSKDATLLQSRLRADSVTEYNVFGKPFLGYIATDKLNELVELYYNDYEYSVSDDNVDILVKYINCDIDTVYKLEKEYCESIVDTMEIVDNRYSFEDAEVAIIKTYTDGGYIRYEIIAQKHTDEDVDDTYVLILNTYNYNTDEFNSVVTDVLNSYTLVDLSGVEL